MKRLTIKEIAQMAGVSVTAVSFVLNNKPGVSEETRQHVQKIIDETGFKPNLNSKKLLFNKSFNICIMINPNSSPFEDLFYFEITRGILNKSREYGYNITINEPIHAESELPDMVYIGDTDGIIFMQDISDALTEKALACGVPFVVVDSHILSDAVTSINPDYCDAAYTAAHHLLENGHRDIGIITSKVVPGFREQTLAGFTKALAEYGLQPRKEWTDGNVSTEQEAYEAAKLLLDRPDRPGAIVCTVDIFAIGAMHCAKDLGLKLPEELSIVGIDDILLSRYTEPKLTTVGIDKVHIGELAMDLLLKKIKGKKPKSVSLPMELVVRESVKKLDT
ncbi:MAG: LacI family DNA-binding transcriptional regulator [Oscillospiraceae bacterium]|nr:LacI family DNA-binding transcriptional regulator [Oscillospiraceae bacterium]